MIDKLSYELGQADPKILEESTEEFIKNGAITRIIYILRGAPWPRASRTINKWIAWYTLDWVEDPSTAPPDVVAEALKAIITSKAMVIDSEKIEKIVADSPPPAGGY